MIAKGHEGVVAKYLAGPYVPGRRVPSWQKIKPRLVLSCVIIGYTTEWEGVLQYAGTLTVGLSTEDRSRLGPLLARRIRPTPVIACPHRSTWVEPEPASHGRTPAASG